MLQIENLYKSFGKQMVLNDISVDIPKGSIFGLLGPNGAGKTTLIRIINQILPYDSGTIKIFGGELHRSQIEKIGYLPEERGLYTKMKVGELLIYLAQLKGLSGKKAKEAIKKLMIEFEVYTWWFKKVEQLSKGMQQKLQFIVAIMHNPELIILDEPFTGFDPINVDVIKQKILELKREGKTFILSTHRMETVEELCDHIALINKSNKILDGEVRSIKATYKSNTFEIGYRIIKSDPIQESNLFDLVDKKGPDEDDVIKAKIKLVNHSAMGQVISHIISTAEIISLNEIMPSINDIFISLVKNSEYE
jgi:ABC-2 type transport system ATP-binding protein